MAFSPTDMGASPLAGLMGQHAQTPMPQMDTSAIGRHPLVQASGAIDAISGMPISAEDKTMMAAPLMAAQHGVKPEDFAKFMQSFGGGGGGGVAPYQKGAQGQIASGKGDSGNPAGKAGGLLQAAMTLAPLL